MKHFFRFLIVSVFFIVSSPTMAYEWKIDHDHSEIRFEVKHIHTAVSGQFSDFNGELFFNPEHLDKSGFNFMVKVKSVNTRNGKRDNHLRSKDFFDSDTFPAMKFESSKITHIKENRYAMEGLMTIKDVTKKMDLEFVFFTPKQHPFDKKKLVAGMETFFTIPRLDFHVGNGKFLKMGVVGKDVKVKISLEALRKK